MSVGNLRINWVVNTYLPAAAVPVGLGVELQVPASCRQRQRGQPAGSGSGGKKRCVLGKETAGGL